MWVKSCKFTDDKADNRAFSRHLRFIGHKKSSMRERLRADIRDEKEREEHASPKGKGARQEQINKPT
ncbi:MAG: hypothetical protein IJ253_09030 [Bacteroidaceae bacterium]|nr:hypothetical protein [Bacteroidaceae bacterium]